MNETSNSGTAEFSIVERLFDVIEARKTADPNSSYTAKLFSDGEPKILRKFGEEAVEVLVAAATGDKSDLIAESADVFYHLMVLWAAKGVHPNEVWAVLSAREGVSGLDEKASRGD
jgi:phosphoribosyl-ATP pyrophosphohydrolase